MFFSPLRSPHPLASPTSYFYFFLHFQVVLFDASKKETHHPSSGYKRLFRRLRSNYKVSVNKDEITLERLQAADAVVFGGPKSQFSVQEFEAVKQYLDLGGSVIFLLSEGGEEKNATNINYFIEEYGMSVSADSVVRTVYHKFLHPKQVYIANGILHPELAEKKSVGRKSKKASSSTSTSSSTTTKLTAEQIESQSGLTFVYPFGASMSVARPSNPILSSGPISFPLNRPVCGVYETDKHSTGAAGATQTGRLIVMGSAEVFSDEFLDKEEVSGVLCAHCG